MANTNDSGRRELPRWMRLPRREVAHRRRAAAYPHAVPPQPEKPDTDSAPDEHAPPRDDPPSLSGEN